MSILAKGKRESKTESKKENCPGQRRGTDASQIPILNSVRRIEIIETL